MPSKIKKVKKVGKVGLAGAKLAIKLKNPINQFKMVKNAIQGKGVVLPGSKYIGPGNAMNLGAPNSSGDAAAFSHDNDYDNLLKAGVKPKKLYLGYSEADQRAKKRADVTTPDGLAVFLGMSAKQGLYKAGLTGKKIMDKDWGVKAHPHEEWKPKSRKTPTGGKT